MRPRGNPNWGKLSSGPNLVVITPSAFEQRANELNLEPHQYAHSHLLRKWAQQNMNIKYVPEDLLKTWKLIVNVRAE
jgi:hypothetical protein